MIGSAERGASARRLSQASLKFGAGDSLPRDGSADRNSLPEPAPKTSRGSSGFTLLEILLVLALIALLASLLIGGSSALLSPKTLSTDELFWKVVQDARKLALETSHEIHLRFDEKA